MPNPNLKPKIVVGMSGGIDSSMSIFLLKKQGFQPVGVTLRLPTWQHSEKNSLENDSSFNQSLVIAKTICKSLDIPHFTWDIRQDFTNIVVGYFIDEIKNQRTPNPCIVCNRYLKLQKLLEWAKNHHINYVATGHYAQIKYNSQIKKYELWRGRDKNKDQSYYLALLKQEQLKHLIFPLGNYYKKRIYQLAQKQQWIIFQQIKESQDFCFINDNLLADFLKSKLSLMPGPIIDKNNPKQQILGKHNGLPLYTLGQREGLGLSNGPFYVSGFDSQNNTLLVTKKTKDLFKQEIIVQPYSLISGEQLKHSILIKAKLRSRQTMHSAKIVPMKNKLKLIFKKPVYCPTPGQFAVWYQNNKCLGGGKIVETN